MIEVYGFYSSLKKDILDDLSFSSGIMKMDSVQLKNLIDYLNSHDGFHLDEMQELMMVKYHPWFKKEQTGLRKLDEMIAVHVEVVKNINFVMVNLKK